MLPTIMRWNSEVVGDVYDELKCGLIQWVESLRVIAELEPITVSREMIPQLAAEAAKQWTGQFNPRPFGESDYVAIYHDAL